MRHMHVHPLLPPPPLNQCSPHFLVMYSPIPHLHQKLFFNGPWAVFPDKQQGVQVADPSIQQFTGETPVAKNTRSNIIQGLDAVLRVLGALQVVKHSCTNSQRSCCTAEKRGLPLREVAQRGVKELGSSVEMELPVKGSIVSPPSMAK